MILIYQALNIDFEKIYNSNTCGPFKIIEDLGNRESRRYVKIRFINTGTEKEVRYDIVMDGKVRDDLFDINFDQIYYSIYYGPFKIIQYIGRDKESKKIVKIKFLNTGYEYNVLLKSARNGMVKDYSVDFHNKALIVPDGYYDKYITRILKQRWKSMMDRCYNINDIKYEAYGSKGVKVCDYWHSFDNYLSSIPNLRNYQKFYRRPTKYSIDKDYLEQNIPISKRIYSPETCMFLCNIDNSNLSIKESHTSKYYGIKEIAPEKYQIQLSINGIRHTFGVYSNLLAALNEYNYYYLAVMNFELVPLLNDGIEPMTHQEALKYLIRPHNTK